MFPNSLLTYLMILARKEGFYALAVLGSGVVNVTLNYKLIPIWAARGAAFATLLTEFILCVWLSIGLKRHWRKVTACE